MIATAYMFGEGHGDVGPPAIPLEDFVRVEGETFGELAKALARAERGEHIRFVIARHGLEIFVAPEPKAPIVLFAPQDLLRLVDQNDGLEAVISMFRVKVLVRDIGHGAQDRKK